MPMSNGNDDFNDLPPDMRMALKLIDANMRTHAAEHNGKMETMSATLGAKMDNMLISVTQRVDRQDDAIKTLGTKTDDLTNRIGVQERNWESRKGDLKEYEGTVKPTINKLVDRVNTLETDKAKTEGAVTTSNGIKEWIRPIITGVITALVVALVTWSITRQTNKPTPSPVRVEQTIQSPTTALSHPRTDPQ